MSQNEVGTVAFEGSERCMRRVAERATVPFEGAGSPWPDDRHI
jgi:hypothetical protein